MAGYVTSERIAEAIATGGGRTAAHTYATVTETVDSWTLKARLDGATEPASVAAFCAAEPGDRIAVTIRPDGRCVAVGRRGGDAAEMDGLRRIASDALPELGRSGIWNYARWACGFAACWATDAYDSGTWSQWNGQSWYAEKAWQASYPFEFADIPFERCEMTLDGFACTGIQSNSSSDRTTKATNIYKPLRDGGVGPLEVTVRCLVVGRWK